jgi:hypothetical protein
VLLRRPEETGSRKKPEIENLVAAFLKKLNKKTYEHVKKEDLARIFLE